MSALPYGNLTHIWNIYEIYIYNPFVDHLPVLSVAILAIFVSQARDGTQTSENAGAMGSGALFGCGSTMVLARDQSMVLGDFLQKRWAIFHRMDFRGPNISDGDRSQEAGYRCHFSVAHTFGALGRRCVKKRSNLWKRTYFYVACTHIFMNV